MPKIVLLINYYSKFDELHRKIKHNEGVSCSRFRFLRLRSSLAKAIGLIRVSAITQKLLKQI